MPSLPTFDNVPDATAARILAAFQNQRDDQGNPLTPAQAYKRWLRENLITKVRHFESTQDPLGNDLT